MFSAGPIPGTNSPATQRRLKILSQSTPATSRWLYRGCPRFQCPPATSRGRATLSLSFGPTLLSQQPMLAWVLTLNAAGGVRSAEPSRRRKIGGAFPSDRAAGTALPEMWRSSVAASPRMPVAEQRSSELGKSMRNTAEAVYRYESAQGESRRREQRTLRASIRSKPRRGKLERARRKESLGKSVPAATCPSVPAATSAGARCRSPVQEPGAGARCRSLAFPQAIDA